MHVSNFSSVRKNDDKLLLFEKRTFAKIEEKLSYFLNFCILPSSYLCHFHFEYTISNIISTFD